VLSTISNCTTESIKKFMSRIFPGESSTDGGATPKLIPLSHTQIDSNFGVCGVLTDEELRVLHNSYKSCLYLCSDSESDKG